MPNRPKQNKALPPDEAIGSARHFKDEAAATSKRTERTTLMLQGTIG